MRTGVMDMSANYPSGELPGRRQAQLTSVTDAIAAKRAHRAGCRLSAAAGVLGQHRHLGRIAQIGAQARSWPHSVHPLGCQRYCHDDLSAGRCFGERSHRRIGVAQLGGAGFRGGHELLPGWPGEPRSTTPTVKEERPRTVAPMTEITKIGRATMKNRGAAVQGRCGAGRPVAATPGGWPHRRSEAGSECWRGPGPSAGQGPAGGTRRSRRHGRPGQERGTPATTALKPRVPRIGPVWLGGRCGSVAGMAQWPAEPGAGSEPAGTGYSPMVAEWAMVSEFGGRRSTPSGS